MRKVDIADRGPACQIEFGIHTGLTSQDGGAIGEQCVLAVKVEHHRYKREAG